jgi:hypothetical protein
VLHWLLRLRGHVRLDVRPFDSVVHDPESGMLLRADVYDWVSARDSDLPIATADIAMRKHDDP